MHPGMLEMPLQPAVKPDVPCRHCYSHPSQGKKGSRAGPPDPKSKSNCPPHLQPAFMPPDVKHLNKAWKVGAQLSSLKAEQAMIHPPKPLGRLFLFITCRWNLANHAPTFSVLGRWDIQLWVESTSFLPENCCTVCLQRFLEKEGRQDFEECGYK